MTPPKLVLSISLCGMLGCASTPPPAAGIAPRSDYRAPAGPPPPSSPGDLPAFTASWTPPSIVAGNVDALGAQLSSYRHIALMLGPRINGVIGEKEAFDLVSALSPQASVVARGDRMLEGLLRERGELPVRVQARADGSHDIFGRPNYVWEGVTLDTTWKDHAPPLSGAEAILVIDDAKIDRRQWQGLPMSSVGSCDAILDAVSTAHRATTDQLAPLLTHADRSLEEAYREVVGRSLPGLVRELAPYEPGRDRVDFGDGPSFEAYKCGVAYREVVDARASCQAGPCGFAPRLLVHEGVRIGTRGDDVYVPSGCETRYGRDVRADVDAIAAAAATAVAEQLDPRWLELAQRASVLGQLQAQLEADCQPRRRRITPESLDRARDTMSALEAELETPLGASTGQWLAERVKFTMPRMGAVDVLFRHEPGQADASRRGVEHVATLAKTLRQGEACRSGATELPVVVLLTDVATSEVRFMSYFYEEELVCGGLAPLSASTVQPAAQ